MGSISTEGVVKLLRSLKYANKLKRTNHSGGLVAGCLLEFKSSGYRCQIHRFENSRTNIVIEPVDTGIPESGFVSGDWIAYGEDPWVPELGGNYKQVDLKHAPVKCFCSVLVDEELATRFAHTAKLQSVLPKMNLSSEEMLVARPQHIIVPLYCRDDRFIVDTFAALIELARCVAGSEQRSRVE